MASNGFFYVKFECKHCFCIFKSEFRLGTSLEHQLHNVRIWQADGNHTYHRCPNCENDNVRSVNSPFPDYIEQEGPMYRLQALILDRYNKWIKSFARLIKWAKIILVLLLIIIFIYFLCQ